jgi:prefoldin subunit 5
MEEDIKILEEFINILIDEDTGEFIEREIYVTTSNLQAIDNILNRLEQLEKENEELKINLNATEKTAERLVQNLWECVPKSVIREKIEELEKALEEELTQVTYWNEIQYTIRVLRKLLGGSNE